MMNRMVGSVSILLILLFSDAPVVAQTYTQMQWGMNKGVTPYAFGVNLNGTWRDLGTVSAAGAWALNLTDLTVSGSATIPFTQSGTGAVASTVDSKIKSLELNALDFGVVVNDASAAATNCTALNNAMAQAAAYGGMTVRVPPGNIYTSCTIDNKYPRVLVSSWGPNQFPQPGTNVTYSTTIVPTFAGTVLKHRTPYSVTSTQFIGGGFIGIRVIGNNIATRLYELDSVSYAEADLMLFESVGADAAYIKSCVSGVDLAGICDVQNSKMKINVWQVTNSGIGIVLEPSSNANFSGNFGVQFTVIHRNGLAADFRGSDNNILSWSSYRAAGGTANSLLCRGVNASGYGCYANVFTRMAATAQDGVAPTIYAEGLGDAGVTTPVLNIVQSLDLANGSSSPSNGTSSAWNVMTNGGVSGANVAVPHVGIGCMRLDNMFMISQSCGQGLEFDPSFSTSGNGTARILAYNRLANAYMGFTLDAGSYTWNVGSAAKLALSSSVATLSVPAKLSTHTFATLPACSVGLEGSIVYISDSNTAVFNADITAGGGANKIMALCNGTNWTAH